MAGIYIHIPFCKSRCIYCDFYSTTLIKWQDRYVNALIEEAKQRSDYLNNEIIDTLYIGGGTPSLLSKDNISKLFDGLKNQKLTEYIYETTFECNPDDVTDAFADTLVENGINRVSMGAQSFSNRRLKFLNRRHNADQINKAVYILKNYGITNISIDLIFGFPEETLEEWIYDIKEAINLDVEHISAYSLMYEKGTLLNRMLNKGIIKEIDEELSRNMYYTLIDILKDYGYIQYEISNFARNGSISHHNSNYWKEIPYLGLGAGAHSYNKLSRQWNIDDIYSYMDSIEKGNISFQKEVVDDNTRYNDMISTALRTCSGIEIEKMPSYRDYLLKSADRSLKNGFLIIDNDHLRLTREGLYISDDIMTDLIFTD